MEPAPRPRRLLFSRRFLRRLSLFALVAAILFVAASWQVARVLTGGHQRPVGQPPIDFPFPIERVSFATEDGHTIVGWYVPGEYDAIVDDNPGKDHKSKASALARKRGIVLLHGYRGDRRQMLWRAKLLREQGMAVLLYDARACGESTGDSVTFGLHEANDLVAAVSWMRETQGIDRIACLGVSQGGATVLLAADRLGDVECVICESVFDELAHAVDNRVQHYAYMPASVAGCLMIPLAEQRTGITMDQVKPVDCVGKFRCPVFIISGDADDKTRPEDTHRLYQAAREPKELWMVPGARHQDLFSQPGYPRRIVTFLAKHFP